MMGRSLALAAFLAAWILPGFVPAWGQETQREFDVVASDLDFPTNVAVSPDGRIFFTEKNTGRVRIIEDGRLRPRPFTTIPVYSGGEAGLLGLALDPAFPDESWVYLYFTTFEHGRLVRIQAEGNEGGRTEILVDGIPTASFHNGGDLAFGQDGTLFLVLGDHGIDEEAQDPNATGGRIMRVDPDGSIPEDNPFGARNLTYSLGHRNSFGLCIDPQSGTLWETENGPSSDDEVNRIEPGGNYGWPLFLGSGSDEGFIDPALPIPEIIVPTGCAFFAGAGAGSELTDALYFGDYLGTLHRVTLSGDRTRVEADDAVVTGLSPIIDVHRGPDGRLYVATTVSILAGPRETQPTTSPSPSSSPSAPATPTAAPGPRTAADDGGGALPWILGGAAVAALAGLFLLIRRR
jgi:glucose/arabinose dehydrogenase